MRELPAASSSSPTPAANTTRLLTTWGGTSRSPPQVPAHHRPLPRYSEVRPAPARLVAWGEWEPPSQVVRRWPARRPVCPGRLHRPYWIEPARRRTTSEHRSLDLGRPDDLQQLQADRRPAARCAPRCRTCRTGSVICFGSTIDGQFCVDTLLVIAAANRGCRPKRHACSVNAAFKTCTGGSITASRTDAHADLTLYRGATLDRPVHGMYSFVPAHPADDGDLAVRPPADPPSRVDQSGEQAEPWGSKRPLPASEVRTAWEQPSSGACRRLGARGRAEDPAEGRGPQCCHRGPTPMLSPLERSASHRGRWRSAVGVSEVVTSMTMDAGRAPTRAAVHKPHSMSQFVQSVEGECRRGGVARRRWPPGPEGPKWRGYV